LNADNILVDSGYTLRVINPILTDGWRKGVEIRKRKTDDIDSLLIAQLIQHRDFVEAKFAAEDLSALRTLTRFRSFLTDSISDLKHKVICVLDQVFPEYPIVFSDVFGATSKEVLLQYNTPADLEGVSVDQLTELLTNLSRKRCGEEQAKRLSQAASNSFGITFCRDSFSFQLRTARAVSTDSYVCNPHITAHCTRISISTNLCSTNFPYLGSSTSAYRRRIALLSSPIVTYPFYLVN
jgi:hypothetical protein